MKQFYFQNYSVYDNEKKGPPIVFLHGLGGHFTHAVFLENVFPEHRIIIPELPGHGDSKTSNNKIDIFEITRELEAVLDHLNAENPIVVGHSLGGQIAMLREIMSPGRSKELLLIAPAGLELFNIIQKQMILSTLQFSNYISNLLLGLGSEWIDKSQSLDSEVIRNYMQSMMERPVKELLNRITCSVHIFFGEKDQFIPNPMYSADSPVNFAKKAVKGLPNFHVHGIPGAGHWPMLENKDGLINAFKNYNQ